MLGAVGIDGDGLVAAGLGGGFAGVGFGIDGSGLPYRGPFGTSGPCPLKIGRYVLGDESRLIRIGSIGGPVCCPRVSALGDGGCLLRISSKGRPLRGGGGCK